MDPADQPHQPDPGAGRADLAEQVRGQGPVELDAAREGSDRLFRFTQFEFPWALGPHDGRYVVRAPGATRDDPAEHVLVLSTLGARERRRLGGRRARKAPPEPEPTPVATARATVVQVDGPFGDAAQASAWLSSAGEAELEAGLAVLNRALHAHRLVTADPLVNAVSRSQALVARVGYGEGEQVAHGRWSEARELPVSARRQRRLKALAPQERLAAVLGGRDRALISEEMALRARLDLEHGREREAALQLRVALDAAMAELAVDPNAAQLEGRLAELRDQHDAVATASQAALAGPLSGEARESVEFGLGRVEAALRARSAAASQ